tara:strand:+ start:7405 stop:9129 length:1725 start_codon:yes stop_codon:yes gene_type:complete
MVCRNCGLAGHNIRTCPTVRSNTEPTKSNINRIPSKKKKKLNDIQSPELEEAQLKLAKIKKERKEQYKTANDCAETLINLKNASIKAEEKTGKRCILEAIHLIMIINHYSNIPDKKKKAPKSVFVTALNRKDTKPQFVEQEEEFGILSVSSRHDKLLGDIVNLLNDKTHDGVIYIHIDECDYGTGEKQSLSKLFNAPELKIPRNINRIQFVTYSATPEELYYSGMNMDEWDFHEFKPSKLYFGARKYKEEGLVFESDTFFDKDITEHGEQIIKEVSENCKEDDIYKCQRNVIVIRDTKPKNLSIIREKKNEISTKYNCEVYIFDQSDGFEWGDPKKWAVFGREVIEDDNMSVIGYTYKPVIVFISQICTRSTEICPFGHRKIYAWHDARKLKNKKAYNTLSQAIGRVKHYTQPGHPENRIKLYCDIDILNITLGDDLETDKLVLAQRISTTRKKSTKIEFIGYEDGFGEDPSSVHDTEWHTGDPNVIMNVTGQWSLNSNNKWCHSDGKFRKWGEIKCLAGHADKRRSVLQYENENSERYLIRWAHFKTTNVDTTQQEPFEHTTKSTSMYTPKSK